MSESFELESPDHFTAGAVGAPGQRTFYLQGRDDAHLVTLKVEKEHVAALAEYLAGLLAQLPPLPGAEPATEGDLVEPVDAAWSVGSIGLGYDESADRVLIVANEAVEEEGGPEPASARFHVTRAQAAAFVERARAVVKAGRPLCPLCSQPRDPGAHVCPRSNGHVLH